MPNQTPARRISLHGASNFRDLGGYAGADGQATRWRRLFRSDHLAGLTVQDARALADLGIAHALDFRGDKERAAMPYHLPGVKQHALPIEPTVVQRMKELAASGHGLTAERTVALMQETYRAFVHDNAPRFAALFDVVLQSDAPLVFHCTAGKDRTGFAAALILLALGVPRPVVMQDYLLTNDFYRMPDVLASSHASPEVLRVLWRVQPEFLDAALHAVDADFGGVDAYLSRQLGMDAARRQRLRAMHLVAPA